MDDMMKMLGKFLKAAAGESTTDEDRAQWPQVGKLSDEHIGKRRSMEAKLKSFSRKVELYKKKVEMMRAQVEVEHASWWDELHEQYGLPADGNFHITDDNRITMEPKKHREDCKHVDGQKPD